MSPEAYYRIVFLIMQRELFVQAFGITEFIASGGQEIFKNVCAQAAGYGFGVLSNRPIDPIKFLPPIISYAQPTYDFITQATGVTRAERVAAIALSYAAAGAWAKVGDLPFNAGIGGVIYLMSQFIEDNVNNSNIPFLLPKTSRKAAMIRRHFSTKKLIKAELAVSGVIIVLIGTTWCIIYILKKSFKYGFKQGSKMKLKKSQNPLKKLNLRKIKPQLKKIFKSKPKVEFIPVK